MRPGEVVRALVLSLGPRGVLAEDREQTLARQLLVELRDIAEGDLRDQRQRDGAVIGELLADVAGDHAVLAGKRQLRGRPRGGCTDLDVRSP